MKKNLVLTGILILLLIVTYVFQEKKAQEEFRLQTEEGLLVTKEITSLKWKDITAVKKEGRWWMGEKLLSHNLFKQIDEKLKRFRKSKEIAGDTSLYFKNAVDLEVNGEAWKIGDMTFDKNGFYLARGTEIMVAYVDGESRELTEDPSAIEKIKLDEFLRLLEAEVIERQLFRYYSKLPLGKVVLNVDGSLPYELDFAKNSTLPPPIPGISVQDKLQEKFIALVTQMTIKEELKPQVLFQKLSTVTLSQGNDLVVWELWIKNKGSADSIIVDPTTKRTFSMMGGTLKLFFVQLQDYWDKKVIPAKEFHNFDRLTMKFTQGTKSADVVLINEEPLKFESKSHKVNYVILNSLMYHLLNLKDKDQADRVSLLASSERKQYLSGENLHINLMKQDLILIRKADELIVANLTQGFKAHFLLRDEKFRGRFEDVLE